MAGWCLKKDTRYRRHCTRLPSAVPGAGGQSALATGRAYTLAFPSPCQRGERKREKKKKKKKIIALGSLSAACFSKTRTREKNIREATRDFWRASLVSQRNGPIVANVLVVAAVVIVVVVVVVIANAVVCLHRDAPAGETRASGRES